MTFDLLKGYHGFQTCPALRISPTKLNLDVRHLTYFLHYKVHLKALIFFSDNNSISYNSERFKIWINSGCDVEAILRGTWRSIKMLVCFCCKQVDKLRVC